VKTTMGWGRTGAPARTGCALSWVAIGCGLALGAQGAPKFFELGPTSSISSDDPRTPLGETWLAGNPRDAGNMVAVSMAFPKMAAGRA
jgi:hypothetical protein